MVSVTTSFSLSVVGLGLYTIKIPTDIIIKIVTITTTNIY